MTFRKICNRIKAGLLFACLLWRTSVPASPQVSVHHTPNESASAFHFEKPKGELEADLGSAAKFRVVEGEMDPNAGGIRKLNDAHLPPQEDQPDENFFFNASTKGGKILVDLKKKTAVSRIVTYSWHPGSRAPQVYNVYGYAGGNGSSEELDDKTAALINGDWMVLGSIDTRKEYGNQGGQYAVSITDSNGMLGSFRYLMFATRATEMDDDFGNTFYSEIEIRGGVPDSSGAETTGETIKIPGSDYEFTVDSSAAPELSDWVNEKIVPMAKEWYPKILELLASEHYSAPKKFSIIFTPDAKGVAATGGTKIRCAADWFSKNRDAEGVGAVFHEIVHVAQRYGRTPRGEGGGQRPPGWLVEGIPDYLRWYVFQPEAHGAEISKRNFARAHFDGKYRITANFLNWATVTYYKNLVKPVNAALRDGSYKDEIWKELTDHTLAELDTLWRESLQAKFDAVDAGKKEGDTKLSPTGKSDGEWKSLFNGTNFAGWHNFKRTDVLPGWEVKNGELKCVDPHNAGDIVTDGSYDWFELQLDYNISEGGNSGIMYHVTDAGGAAWATGPEFQLEDNKKAADPQRCGWLYALYRPEIDPKTGLPIDATKPAGEWNHVRLLISPQKCEHEINGVVYFTYVLDSEDFKERVAKSKFGKMPNFAKFKSGSIALQGDHGQVSFRNIKIKSLPESP